MENAGLFQIQIKNFNYWLPSFLPVNWAVITSKIKFLNNLKLLCWLFSGIGIKK